MRGERAHFIILADLPREPDPVAAWIKLDLPTRSVVGRRLELGASPEIDEELDKLIVLRGRIVEFFEFYDTAKVLAAATAS